MSNSFKKLIFSKLPFYFKRHDSFKDDNNQGVLERFCESLGLELDEETLPKLLNYLDQHDLDEADEGFVNYLAHFYGKPPSVFNDEDYRTLLKGIISIYKIKGTEEAFRVLFSIMGYDVSITKYPPTETLFLDQFNLDENHLFDTECSNCIGFDVSFTEKNFDNDTLSGSVTNSSVLDKLSQIIAFNKPINTTLVNLIQNIAYRERLSIEPITTEVDFEVFSYSLLDTITLDEDNFDDSVTIEQGNF